MARGLNKNAAEKELDAAVQRAMNGRSISVMRIGPMYSAIKNDIACGKPFEDAVADAINAFTEPA